MTTSVHIIGAGLAGLAAAVELSGRGFPITLYEMTRHAGGRCRTYNDVGLGARIDNGNHLIMRGNTATLAYLKATGGRSEFHEVAPARFPFINVASGERWTVSPSAGRFPAWLFDRNRRPPGFGLADVGAALRILTARQGTVADCLDTQRQTYRTFWEPLTVAALNTPPERAAAALLRPVLLETFGKGEAYCRPMLARTGLGDALIDPAIRLLERSGATIRFGSRIRALVAATDDAGAPRVVGFDGSDGREPLEPDAAVIVATPTASAAELLGSPPPHSFESILNLHFRLETMPSNPPPITGLIGGLAQWAFVRDSIVSVTISCAGDYVPKATAEAQLIDQVWREIAMALDLPVKPMPAHRVIHEKRATPSQTPSALASRPKAQTRFSNVLLAGDWIDTGLPATIESAVRSGQRAAKLVLQRKKAYAFASSRLLSLQSAQESS